MVEMKKGEEWRSTIVLWLKMSLDSDKACGLLSQESRTSCVFRAADEKDDIPGVGEDSVLEMLSYSKFSDLETWLCMPSTLLPRALETPRSSPPTTRLSTCSETGETDTTPRPLEKEAMTQTLAVVRETPFLATPLTPILSSTPCNQIPVSLTMTSVTSSGDSASQGGVSVRKRRRLAASPGGLHWNSRGSVQRDFDRKESSPISSAGGPTPAGVRSLSLGNTAPVGEVGGGWREREALRKMVSVDDRLMQPSSREQHIRVVSRLERSKNKLRNIHSLGLTGRYEPRKKSDSKISRLAQRLNQRPGDDLIKDFSPLLYTGVPRSAHSLDRNFCSVSMTQQMQNLQLSQTRKCPVGPTSPNAAKRLYRNLSEKLKGGHSSFEDAYFFGRGDRHGHRKGSNMQGNECLFEAVEQQDLDSVQILLYQYNTEELDLNTPNSEGLTPLDIAIMTNNTPIAKLLLKAGAKESPHFVRVESREAHLNSLVKEAERRVEELASQAQREGLSLDACDKNKQLRAWEWKSKLYQRMRTGFQQSRVPEAPSAVCLTVASSSSLTVTFQEPHFLNSAVVTKYRVEWSCLKDFSLLAGDMVLENLQTLKCTINGLTTGRQYYVQVSAYNMKGWGAPQQSLPASAVPSNWRESEGREPRRRGYIEAMERLLQQVRATHTHYSCGDTSKLQNPSRKQSVSRSLKHLFNSSNKFVKTLKRGVYLAAVFYHKDSVLVTTEDHIPIVEVDDSYGSSLMQDFLWFTKLSCMWEDVRWLRQSMCVSMSSSSTLQARQKMLSAAGQLQNILGTHNLGRVHYEPIKDRHGNVLLVTIRDMDNQSSFFTGRWMQVTKLQSQRKSLSTPEEPYALDILLITIQDILAFQRRSQHRLSHGLYLGYLKLSSSVDQIRVLVPQRIPNMLCHVRVRDNANVSREEWDWLQRLSTPEDGEKDTMEGEREEVHHKTDSNTPLLYYELQMSLRALLKLINLPLHQAKHFRIYTQEVLELGHNVSFLLLLPAADDVCTAPGQINPYTPHSGFLNLPLQMFELVHFSAYKEKCISLYCRMSSVLDLDSLITQQALREAITDTEVATAKQRHQHILEYTQQLDEMWRELRWITDALQYARYKHPRGGVPITNLVTAGESEPGAQKSDSASSTMEYLPSPSPSPELRRRKPVTDSQLGSDEDGCSEVFLPTDSDYDSSEALSPRELDLLYSPPQDLSQQAVHALGGSAPDVLQIQDLRYTICPSKDVPLSAAPFLTQMVPSPLSPALTLPETTLSCAKTLEGLSLTKDKHTSIPLWPLANPPTKRKMLSRSHGASVAQQGFFTGPQRWLKGHSDSHMGSLSEGVYTRHRESNLPLDLPSLQGEIISQAPCVLEGRRGGQREPRPHVRRIFVEPCKETSPETWGWVEEERGMEEKGGMEREEERGVRVTEEVAEKGHAGAPSQDVDSDDQTNSQMSDILSSTL
ncbi:ankyrin repeat and fibronectin type-III domain-containing protein 1 isoform X2 [Esox lucius]|uniref:ankyrin repeat and fibronectin type-III domain-containing protein 1 isoform X2 n=1 Tax=Esox lucius TaxID=8010 RepID=UPI001476D388|nr:ankyrin repeat and fibronectin type-III domain-containing protein 1 isoform X2 [Esox lucius]